MESTFLYLTKNILFWLNILNKYSIYIYSIGDCIYSFGDRVYSYGDRVFSFGDRVFTEFFPPSPLSKIINNPKMDVFNVCE